ncbi:polysaccharide deacetylase family protein [Corticibacter populi]|nr:polysaccharide deacetylase family protein [Corticibacter populi]RZS32079.1 peptidoglycan/xylan/chitin deacetylase (PgdA/CDA1 family) [Corticibacter populi]
MTPTNPDSELLRRFAPQAQQLDWRWPGGRGLAISFVLNIEEGAELAIGAGDSINEAVHEVTHAIADVPDLCMQTHFEYGARAGYARIASRFIAHGLPLTLNVCGRALEHTPWVTADALAHDWELCGHGWRWESPAHMDEATERATILRTMDSIGRHWGRRPTGWHCKSSASLRTRTLLQELGFLYDSNDYGGEVPCTMRRGDGSPYVILPYAFDTNDMRFFGQGAFVQADDFARYVIEAIEVLQEEARQAPRLLTIGLHTRILGRPARIRALDRILQHVQAQAQRQPAWVATREAMARHWLQLEQQRQTA